MIIKNRQFKVEKMGDFLAQNTSQHVIPVRIAPQSHPVKNHSKPHDQVLISYELEDNRASMIHPSPKPIKNKQRKSISKVPLPQIVETPEVKKLPPIRSIEKLPRNSKALLVSRSTPKIEYKTEIPAPKQIVPKGDYFQQKSVDATPSEDLRKRLVDATQVKAFSEKYNLEFQEGYYKNALMRCVELINTESDPHVLMNILPDKYQEFVSQSEDFKPGFLPSIGEVNRRGTSKSNLIGSYTPLLPGVLNGQIGNKGFTINKLRDYNSEKGDFDTLSEHDNYTVSSSMSVNYKPQLPKVDLETFEQSLDYFKETGQDGNFLIIKAKNKGITCEFGFCEIVFNEKKKDSACITKYFVARAYRKMKMVLPITLGLVEHLFQSLKLDKLSIKAFSDNNFAQNDLRLLGFKLEKIDFEKGRKVKIYSIKRGYFREVFESLAGKEML